VGKGRGDAIMGKNIVAVKRVPPWQRIFEKIKKGVRRKRKKSGGGTGAGKKAETFDSVNCAKIESTSAVRAAEVRQAIKTHRKSLRKKKRVSKMRKGRLRLRRRKRALAKKG